MLSYCKVFFTLTGGEGPFNALLVANCVLNAFLSFTAIVFNIIAIQALRKTSLAKPLKTLLSSLAISDLGVGLLVQPLYIAVGVWEIRRNGNYNNVINVFIIYSSFFSYASFFGVVGLTVDRFLAIHLHLGYQELVTHKRVVIAVISAWVFSAFLSIPTEKWIPEEASSGYVVIEAVCIITSGVLYCKIYATVRRLTNRIHALEAQQSAQNGEIANVARLRKTSVATFYVYASFLACYLPFSCVYPLYYVNSGKMLKLLLSYTLTLVYLNSSLNPLIYCWKMKHIRQAVLEILRNTFSNSQ